MEIKVVPGHVMDQKADAIIVNIFEGVEQPVGATGSVDKALGGLITKLIASGEIKGKSKEVTLIHTQGKIAADRVLVLGLGKEKDFRLDDIRSLAAEACQCLRQIGVRKVATILIGRHAGGGIEAGTVAQAMTEGSLLGQYSYRQYMTTPPEHQDIEELIIVDHSGDKKAALEKGIDRGVIAAEATKLARDMGNEPSNVKTPVRIADQAVEIGRKHGLSVTVLDKKQITELGMGCLLGVGQGSQHEPRLVVVSYRGDPSTTDAIGLVGKGITFDTGGIDIKPDDGMREMKTDMAGAAAVICAVQAVAQLKPRINVTAVAPLAENMPDGAAFKPGDVIKAMNGKTVEIISTDAEGRLLLADGILYARKLGLSPIIDVATLTGACRIALGTLCCGGFTNNQDLLNEVMEAGKQAAEPVWQFPMFEEYKEGLKSEVADIQNHGGREAGAIVAAQFIGDFAESVPWVHLDIAGTARSEKDKGYLQKGSTGSSVRTLINFVMSRAEKKG